MSAANRTRELEEALAALPRNVVGEIAFGRLVTQPRPAMPHAITSLQLSAELSPAFRHGAGGPGGWIFANEPELGLGPHVLVPDLAGWRVDSLAPNQLHVARTTTAPDWICELISPSTEAFDRDEKALIYAANGVGHLWIVDPVCRTLEAKRNERGRWLDVGTLHGDVAERIEPFDAVALDWSRVWMR